MDVTQFRINGKNTKEILFAGIIQFLRKPIKMLIDWSQFSNFMHNIWLVNKQPSSITFQISVFLLIIRYRPQLTKLQLLLNENPDYT